MWQAPNQRVKALVIQRARQRERQRKPIHIKRVMAEIKSANTAPLGSSTLSVTSARVLLNDISEKGVGLLSNTEIYAGQDVFLTIPEPKCFYVKGKVIWCAEHHAATYVISNQSMKYRIGIEFQFSSPEEQKAIQEFVDHITKQVLYAVRPAL